MSIFPNLFAKNSLDTEALDKLVIAIVSSSTESGASARKFMSFSMDTELKKEQLAHVDIVFIYFLLHVASREYSSMFGHTKSREFVNNIFPIIIPLVAKILMPTLYETISSAGSNEYSTVLQEIITDSKKSFDAYNLTYSKCKDILSSEMEIISDKSLFLEAAMNVISQTDQKTEPYNLRLITMIMLDAIKKVDFPAKLAAIGRI